LRRDEGVDASAILEEGKHHDKGRCSYLLHRPGEIIVRLDEARHDEE
jgi:hypothetical protein